MITLVLTNSLHQFEDWCREREINPRDPSVKYVWRLEDLRGLGQRVKVVVDDSFFWSWKPGNASLLEGAHYVEVHNQIYPETDDPPKS
jgi:hypothetical protein